MGLAVNRWGKMGAGGNRYRYNGIEHVEEVGLDMAPFRSYDAAIGRWTQVDPMAELMPSMTPYRFGFNNPALWSDPLGLFESRKAAKAHAKANGIRLGLFSGNKVKKESDGTFEIRQSQGNGIYTSTQDLGGDLGVMEGVEVKANDEMQVIEAKTGFSPFPPTGGLRGALPWERESFFEVPGATLRDGSTITHDAILFLPGGGGSAVGGVVRMGPEVNLPFKALQKAVRGYSNEMNPFFKSGGKIIPSKGV